MTCWAVLATGPSMSQEVANSVKGRCKVVAVSDSYRLAPWADAMASSDAAWWKANPAAKEFAGRKFSAAQIDGVEKVDFEGPITSGSNSGLLAAHVAWKLGATKILLCGFDLHGAHFFGLHPVPLKNTKPGRFEVFQEQFRRFKPRGVKVLNCTPGSALRVYPTASLDACLAEPALHGS
jgi:hypothetical protein